MKMPATMVSIRVMCSSRVDPLFVLKAFLGGADGVLVAGCHPGDCHYQTGNYYTRRRFAVTQRVFDELGLETNRVSLKWVSASEGGRFQEVVTEFSDAVSDAGPNPAKQEIYL